MMRAPLLAAILALPALLGGCKSAPPPAPAEAPVDVVLVMIDTLRADHVGAHGYERPTTPNLDRLAADGALFENARANCSWTRPSMASALSGLWPRETGVIDEHSYDRVPDDVVLLSERLRDAGYGTVGVTANPNLNPVFGFDQGFDTYVESGAVWSWMREERYSPVRLMDAADVTDEALKLAGEVEGPLYLQAVYLGPHTPLQPPKRYEREFVAEDMDDDAREVALYDAEVAFTDAEVQRLLDGLAQLGRADPLVVVFADHGEGLFDHPDVPFTREHGYVLYDSNLRVPWMLRHSSIPAGTRIAEPVQLLDLLPTVLDLAGHELPPGLPGQSLAPELRGEAAVPRPEYVIAETDRAHTSKTAIVAGERKLIRNHDHPQLKRPAGRELGKAARRQLLVCGRTERYDLTANAAAGQPERPRLNQAVAGAAYAVMQQQLADWEEAHPKRTPVRPAEGDVDPAVIEQLRQLGYVE